MKLLTSIVWVFVLTGVSSYGVMIISMAMPPVSILLLPFYLILMPPMLYSGVTIIDGVFE